MALESIAGTDTLRRLVPPDQVHEDGTISIAAFKTKDLSVDLARMRTRAQSVADRPGHGAAEFEASVATNCGLEVQHQPLHTIRLELVGELRTDELAISLRGVAITMNLSPPATLAELCAALRESIDSATLRSVTTWALSSAVEVYANDGEDLAPALVRCPSCLTVTFKPNPAHCLIPGKIKEGQAKKLRTAAKLVVPPGSTGE